jgi:hypothetical protein
MRLHSDCCDFSAHDEQLRDPCEIEVRGAGHLEHRERHQELAREYVGLAFARIARPANRERWRVIDVDWIAQHETHAVEKLEMGDLVRQRKTLAMRMLACVDEGVTRARVLAAVRTHCLAQVSLVVRDAEVRDNHAQIDRRFPHIAGR